ncbi:pentatricopeptide repeat-containing protein At4g18520, chloroplastic [Cryptomeria japonica]|uniref:pentatricopeptide repeat-containing protein At4g18520, chloroplastic n=1 Tax=Cryptomeria japonica TaxID=3369 RepID=UPI0027D9F62C|nr:pentatricopeptide repeat-containing protein At4g18520, chloroplastic [Cryptomeria japonica]
MATATWVPISCTFNPVTDKPRLYHGSVQVHHFPFSNLNFINHIDSSLGCFRKCKQQKLKTLVTKDDCTFFENEQVNHGIDIEQFESIYYASMLQECVRRKSVREGKQIHAQVIKYLEEADVFLGTSLLNMYAKCGSLVDARQVFDKMPERSIVSWTAMLTAYIQNGYWEDSLKLMGSMHDADIMPDQFTLPSLLRVCASMRDPIQGKMLHGMAIKTGFVSDVYVDSALVDMYAKCNLLMDARRVFDKISEPNVVSWTAIIRSYVQNKYHEEAINLFSQMQWSCTRADAFTLNSVLTACANLEDLQKGKQVHVYIIKSLPDINVWVGNALITMYSKSGETEYAFKVFERMSKRNVVSWTAMIAGYGQNGCNEEAVELFKEMHFANVKPNSFTFDSVLAACFSLKYLRFGKQVHAQVWKNGLTSDSFVESALVNLYAKCGHMEDAHNVFDQGPKNDAVLLSTVITGYVEYGYDTEALNVLNKMRLSLMNITHLNFSSILKACACVGSLNRGKEIHAQALKTGLDLHLFVGTSLIDMYSKCGNIDDALKMFNEMPAQNIVSWNAMIAGCIRNGLCKQALNFFRQMQIEGIKPDEFTFASILGACASLAAFELGKQVHVCVIKGGYESDGPVQNTIDIMYAKVRFIHNSYKMFDKLPEQNVVS